MQEQVAAEARAFMADPSFSALSKLRLTRDVFREALRLYPPVPMMVRQTVQAEALRDRQARRGDQVVLSPWHLHRQTRLWNNPDGFDPGRWQTDAGRESARKAYIPFSAGPRVCTGAGFAMAEGVLLLAAVLAEWRVSPGGAVPVPEAHLTVRARDGIWLKLERREVDGSDAKLRPRSCPKDRDDC